jgi:hypothetical protein
MSLLLLLLRVNAVALLLLFVLRVRCLIRDGVGMDKTSLTTV